MLIRWSPEAAADFVGIIKYIRHQNPSAADRVAHSIYDSVTLLEPFPNKGRQGRVRGTRELVVPSLPFIVIYRINPDAVEIVRLLHGSQRWA